MELKELYYKNSAGKIIDFMKEPYLPADISEIENFYWKMMSESSRISGYGKEINSFPLTLNVYADTDAEYNEARERLFEILEYDVLNNAPGRLYYNGQFVFCTRSSSTKLDWTTSAPVMKNRLEFTVEKPCWIEEIKYEFLKIADQGAIESVYFDYPYDYPHDYAPSNRGNAIIENDNISACDFDLIIFGECINPKIHVDEQIYGVMCTVDDGEYITISSRGGKGTVIRTKNDGSKKLEFNARIKEPSVFTPIPPGSHSVYWDGTFGFLLVLYKERSEPKCSS